MALAYKTHNEVNVNIDGTHLQGYLAGSYDRLVEMFGEPIRCCDDKVRVEWDVLFEDGTVATIYDWKEIKPVEQVTEWYVGGHSSAAPVLVDQIVRSPIL